MATMSPDGFFFGLFVTDDMDWVGFGLVGFGLVGLVGLGWTGWGWSGIG